MHAGKARIKDKMVDSGCNTGLIECSAGFPVPKKCPRKEERIEVGINQNPEVFDRMLVLQYGHLLGLLDPESYLKWYSHFLQVHIERSEPCNGLRSGLFFCFCFDSLSRSSSSASHPDGFFFSSLSILIGSRRLDLILFPSLGLTS